MTKKTMFEMAFPNANTGNGVTFTEKKLGGEKTKELINKIKEYLEIDLESNSDENCKLYAKQLLEWINKWENQ